MVRSIDGQGFRITRYPPDPGGTGSPSRVTISALMPGSGRVQEPGFVGVVLPASVPGNLNRELNTLAAADPVSLLILDSFRPIDGVQIVAARVGADGGGGVGRLDDRRGVGAHSTVTLLARLRGWSTSQPRSTAM